MLSVRSLIAANQALLAPLEQNASQAEHLLAMLEGVVPSKANLPDIDLTGLSLPADLPLSLPSDLVNQRPDILSAEALMHVASANIGIATAAMFPSFSLSGTYGGASTTLANLSAVSKFWSIGPTATTPVFQGNSLWYVRRAAIDAYQQSQANYRQTVLGAFEQVADSLKALEHDAEGLQAQVEARRAAGEALNLLQVNYRAGLVAYPDVLAADVQFHQATIGYLQAVAQRHQDTVALFVALGGGWWNEARPGRQKGGAMRYGGILRIGFKLLVNDKPKFTALLIGITFSVFLMMMMTAMFAGILNHSYSTVTNIGADMWVMDPSVNTPTSPIPMPDYVLDVVRSMDEVSYAVPLFIGGALVKLAERRPINLPASSVWTTRACLAVPISNKAAF